MGDEANGNKTAKMNDDNQKDNIGVDPTAIGRVDPPMKDIV